MEQPTPPPRPPTDRPDPLAGEGCYFVPRRLAVAIDTEAAMFVRHLSWLLSINDARRRGDEPDAGPWILATRDEWTTEFPQWSREDVRRVVAKCAAAGVVVTVNHPDRIRTWYGLALPALEALLAETTTPALGQLTTRARDDRRAAADADRPS